MNYDEALEYINAVPRFAKTNTLERVREILSAFGSPEKSLNCIHVAGTNGKGSTVMMLSNIFRAAGKRVGTFVSPFVYDFRERIQLDCAPIEKQAFADICSRVRDVVNNLLDPPNAFEILTATALIFFSEAKCDIVVLEVGLGGTWDATNVIPTPMLAVICSIALDHMAILGNTLPEIAHEKCGIIKNGGVVVTGSMHESDVMAIIEDTCKERGATLITAHSAPRPIRESVDGTVFEYNGESVSLSLPGEYQLANVALVIAAAEALTLPTSAVIRGLSETYIPARMEVACHSPLCIIDGAHNSAGMTALYDSIKNLMPNKRISVIFGCLRDKGYADMTKIAAQLADDLILISPNSPRAANVCELVPFAKNAITAASPADAIKIARATNPDAILVCGSLYLAGEMSGVKTIIETERTTLRELTQADYTDLAEILCDAEVMRAYEHAFSDYEVQQWLNNQRARYREFGFGLWAVISKESGEMLGQAGITMQCCNGRNVPEIGYLFKKKYWHAGYATEAAIACKNYAFDTLLYSKVYSIIRDTNVASQRVAERNGMTCHEMLTKHYYGVDMPHLVFSVSK